MCKHFLNLENTESEIFYLACKNFYKKSGEEPLFYYWIKMMERFNKRKFVNVNNLMDGKLYRPKLVEMNKERQAVKVHYVG